MEIGKLSTSLKYNEELEYLLTYKDDYTQYRNCPYLSGIVQIVDQIYVYDLVRKNGYYPFSKRYIVKGRSILLYKSIFEIYKYQKFTRELKAVSNFRFICSYIKYVIYDFIRWNFYYRIKRWN